MTLIFKDLINKICLVYIDDVLVFGEDKEAHDKNLKKVLERINEYNLQENHDKRIECVKEIRFLGYDISFNTIKPSFDRAIGITSFEEPKNKKQLQRFLGLVNYDRIFIKNLSEKLQDLYSLLNKDKKFTWTNKERGIFESVKKFWKEKLEITIPNDKDEFVLETDASNTGIGAVLKQNNKQVAFVSRLLTKEEKNYSITEKEVLASLWAMEKLQFYLLGKEFILRTDHKAIEELKKKERVWFTSNN